MVILIETILISILLYENKVKANEQDSSSSGYSYVIDPRGPSRHHYLTPNEMENYFQVTPESYKFLNFQVEPDPPIFVHSTLSTPEDLIEPSPSKPTPFRIKGEHLTHEPLKTHDSIIVENNFGKKKKKKNDGGKFHKDDKGGKYGDEHRKEKGHKTKKEYSSDYAYSKGSKGAYDKKYDAGKENEEVVKKASKDDEHEKEADYNVEKGGHKEGKYDEQHQRKKGKKSKGYHNIFMKDEYKKDHTFYDMDHHQGHFDKKGSDNVKYHKNDEESEKGEKSDKEEDSHFDGKKGELAKGNHDKKDSHYKKESKYHNDKDDKESFKYDKGKHMGGHHYEIEH